MPEVRDVPFETTLLVRDTCLCLHVQRAARALARYFDEELRPSGLNNGQFSLLMSLSPPPMKPVAELLAMDQTTLTAALKPLQRNGWVEVIINPKDRRERLLVLTSEGQSVLASAVPIWTAAPAKLESTFPGNNLELFRQELVSLGR